MNAKAQVKTQAKTPVAPAAARIPQPPVAELEHEAERPDIAAQLEGAARLGHRFGALGVDHSPPPLIQRQEIPEEEEEELQLKREPAAVQRQELPEEEEEELMMKPDEGRVGPQGGQVPPDVEAAIHRARGGGQPLEGALQEQMSASLGHDLSRVRVHTDAEADALNQQLTARAFTTGRDIFFRQGEYNPGSDSGRVLIGHELTHVVQQTTGRVRGDQGGMIVRPSGDAFEQEAEHAATQQRQDLEKSKAGVETRATSRPDWPSPAEVEALQNTIGNRPVERLLAHGIPEWGSANMKKPMPTKKPTSAGPRLHLANSDIHRSLQASAGNIYASSRPERAVWSEVIQRDPITQAGKAWFNWKTENDRKQHGQQLLDGDGATLLEHVTGNCAQTVWFVWALLDGRNKKKILAKIYNTEEILDTLFPEKNRWWDGGNLPAGTPVLIRDSNHLDEGQYGIGFKHVAIATGTGAQVKGVNGTPRTGIGWQAADLTNLPLQPGPSLSGCRIDASNEDAPIHVVTGVIGVG